MDEIFSALILGLVQGVTEWLPVSSSGHLAILESVFKLRETIFFNVLLHLASLLAILVYLRSDIFILVKDIFKKKKESVQYLSFIIIGTLPIAFVGIIFKDAVEGLFMDLGAVAIALIFTGIVLLSTKKKSVFSLDLNHKTAFLIGVAQSIAVIPGISRSGMTIASAMLIGMKREDAARFSFFLFIPAILGATLLELYSVPLRFFSFSNMMGFVAAFSVGLLSIRYLMKIVRNDRFYRFAYYCFFIAVVTFILVILGDLRV